ncbi:sigma factor-like helix-turn-helix DNA-binding protein [Novosphingobium colocasiae]
MAKPLRLTKAPKKPEKALVPIASSAGLASELKALTDRLSDDPGVKKFTVTVNKETGIAKATAVGHRGQTFTQEVVGPGLTATMTYTPPKTRGGKAARDQNIVALYERDLTQMEIAERLDVSQSTVSNVLRREGLR